MRSSLAAVLFIALLSACTSPGPVLPATAYPSELVGFAEYEKFPLEVSGYKRWKVIAYGPALTNYSIGYNRFDQQLQNSVTLYFYPRPPDASALLAGEVAAVQRAHPDGKAVSQRTLSFEQGGQTYEAPVVTFEYTDVFAGQRQELWSQLVLIALPQRAFKVRATAPKVQGGLAETELRQLLQRVKWAQ